MFMSQEGDGANLYPSTGHKSRLHKMQNYAKFLLKISNNNAFWNRTLNLMLSSVAFPTSTIDQGEAGTNIPTYNKHIVLSIAFITIFFLKYRDEHGRAKGYT